jgi:putative ABC transport system permease protein
MLKNYFVTAIRNIRRRLSYSALNIFGLAVGLASCLLILLFVNDELLYDQFHPEADRLYRVALERSYPDRTSSYAVAPMPVARTMVRDYPEVEAATQIATAFPMAIRYEDKAFQEEGILFADSSFFKVFGIEPLKGDPGRLFNEPRSIVLTSEMAQKYFVDKDPLGEQLELDIGTFTVTGVVSPMPRHSHFHFDFVASLVLPWLDEDDWLNLATTQYIRLTDGADAKALEEKIPLMVERYAGQQIQAELGISFEKYLADGNGYNYFLQPITDIHLRSNLEYELEPNGDMTYVYLFSIIAIAILLIAGVNFVNISTAQAITRAREVGVRKTLGSQRTELMVQFLLESILLSFLALGIALVFVDLLLPFFNQLAGKDLSTNTLLDPWFLTSTLGIAFFVGVTAGIYPAFFLSAFRPVNALKGRLGDQISQSRLRRGLMVLQFTLSIILLTGTWIVLQQINYVFDKNLGFEKDQRLIIERAGVLNDQQYSFMQTLYSHTNVLQASRSNGIPGYNFSGITVIPVDPPKTPITARYAYTDDTFLETYAIDIIEGRNFSRERASDSLAIIINRRMAEFMDLDSPVGKQVTIPGDRRGSDVPYTIVGVMENVHHESLHKPIGPMLIRHDQGPRYPLISIHLATGEVSQTIDYLEAKWEEYAPGQPFSYFFFDQHYNDLYHSEIRTSRVLTSFTILSFVLTFLGLIGLSAYAIARRRKEIGIHKIHGASITRIIVLLTKEYFKLVVIAFFIASPVAYYLLQGWLQDFAYKIDLGILPFLLVGLLTFFIALLTISWQATRAAIINPVESLRSE